MGAMRSRSLLAACITGTVLAAFAMPASAVGTFVGWNAQASQSGIDWSSDLGPDFRACVYAAGCNVSGTTTPGDIASGALIKGQTVTTQVSRNLGGVVAASMLAELQPGASIEGAVTHFRLDASVPDPFGVYGLGATNSAYGSFAFSGLPAPASIIYYFVAWSIDVDTIGGALMDYRVRLSGDGPEAIGIAAGDLSGSFSGSKVLVNSGFAASTDGSGFLFPDITFALLAPSGSSRPGAGGVMNVWMTFSSAPVTGLPSVTPVPEPSSLSLLALGVVMLGWMRRQRHRQPA